MRDSDPVDSMLVMRVGLYFGPACFIVLTALWFKLLVEGTISTGVFVVLLVANVPITLAGITLIYRSISGTATFVANTLTAGGDIPPPPSYPNQDVLIAQGKHAEAADYFRDHLRVDPADCDARLRLAELCERYLADPGGARSEEHTSELQSHLNLVCRLLLEKKKKKKKTKNKKKKKKKKKTKKQKQKKE